METITQNQYMGFLYTVSMVSMSNSKMKIILELLDVPLNSSVSIDAQEKRGSKKQRAFDPSKSIINLYLGCKRQNRSAI